MPGAKSRRGGDRGAHVGPRIDHRVAQSETLRQPRRHRARQRAAGAVRMARGDARRGKFFDAVNRGQQIHHLLARQVAPFSSTAGTPNPMIARAA